MCHYCGQNPEELDELKYLSDELKNNPITKLLYITEELTIDRMDSFKGYSEDNIVKCCMICNTSKGGLISYENFKLIARKNMRYIKNELWKMKL